MARTVFNTTKSFGSSIHRVVSKTALVRLGHSHNTHLSRPAKDNQDPHFDITDDGKTVVLIKDHRVVLWDFETGKEIRQFC
jgi:hypothetical protein